METDRTAAVPKLPARAYLPTAAELDAEDLANLQSVVQHRLSTAAQGLSTFLSTPAVIACIVPKGSDQTNVIDQKDCVNYALPPTLVDDLFVHLEACRRDGVAASFSERQATPATPEGGLMLDFDYVTSRADVALTDRVSHRITARLASRLQRDLEFSTAGDDVHVFFIEKVAPVRLTSADPTKVLYRHGFHILVPGVRVPRSYKKYLMREFRGDTGLLAALAELGVGPESAAEALDLGSASVPVLFAGSAKRGKEPYRFVFAYEVNIDGGDGAPIVRVCAPAELEGLNLVREMTLVTPCAPATLVRRAGRQLRATAADEARRFAERAAEELLSDEELAEVDQSLSTLGAHDPEAAYLRQLLDLLEPRYAADYESWRNVIFALANTSEAYKPLAVYFSQKCPEKWAAGGAAALETVWASALICQGGVSNPLSKRSLIRWAMLSNPERFREVSDKSYHMMLTRFIYEYGGTLEHDMIAKVLFAMLGNKFVVDTDGATAAGRQNYVWYEFVIPGQPCRQGEIWKWRREAEPDEIHIYMSEMLSRLYCQVDAFLVERRDQAQDETHALYYKGLLKKFALSKVKIFNDGYKRSVISQAHYRFRQRGFIENLDRTPNVLGVGNGVLELGARCRLVNHFHEYAVSRYTPVPFVRFDPQNLTVRALLDAIADIIPEPDARDWFLYFAASSLAGGTKSGILLLCQGGGCNGKTFLMRLIAKALGDYGKKLNISILTSDRESADRPNSAIMQLKGCRWGYVEETDKAEVLNTQRLKEIANPGDISGRDLNTKQETFEITANVIAGLNFNFIVNTTDHGTWRRLRSYKCRTTFKKNPDPRNPYEKKDDPRFVNEYINDPEWRAAMLSILVHYYERLQAEHNGDLKRVPCKTIERETEIFRNSQDSMNRFLTECMAISPQSDVDYPLTQLAAAYFEWHHKNIGTVSSNTGCAIVDIQNSGLAKYFQRTPNRTVVVRGCRLLSADNRNLHEGESYYGVGGAVVEDVSCECDWVLEPSRPDWWMPVPAENNDLAGALASARAGRAGDRLASLHDDMSVMRGVADTCLDSDLDFDDIESLVAGGRATLDDFFIMEQGGAPDDDYFCVDG